MYLKFCFVLFWLDFMCSPVDCRGNLQSDFFGDRLNDNVKKQNVEQCSLVHITPKDVTRRFYAILPYFDRDHSNMAFLHKFRATVYGMSEAEDLLDREVAYYATILTPLVFLQQYRDIWCLLERFHRAIRLYQVSHPTQKRSALKLLQNLRSINQKISDFIADLPGPTTPKRTALYHEDIEQGDLHNKNDIRYLKELIKNLG